MIQIKPQVLPVVPFRQFLKVPALRPYSARNPKTLTSYGADRVVRLGGASSAKNQSELNDTVAILAQS